MAPVVGAGSSCRSRACDGATSTVLPLPPLLRRGSSASAELPVPVPAPPLLAPLLPPSLLLPPSASLLAPLVQLLPVLLPVLLPMLLPTPALPSPLVSRSRPPRLGRQ